MRDHRSLPEGARLGLIVGAGIWLWVAIVDAVAGQPFYTFRLLGGVAAFTALHFALNIVYGVALVAAVHGAAREPSLLVAVGFGSFVLEFGIAMVTVLLSNAGLGRLAWIRILGGSLLGAAIAFTLVARTHPLKEELRRLDAAERE